MFGIITAAALLVLAGPPLPEDGRLAEVRPQLQRLVDQASAAGLPADLLVSKVREGLAKGVEPARIEGAAERLFESLDAAQRLVGARRGNASPPLVRAVAEARLAGVALPAVEPLLDGQRPEGSVRRAVEVVTELSLRGYPAERAVRVVGSVLGRDARSLDRVPSTLETIRRDYALSQSEAADALARGLASSDSLQAAYNRTAEDEHRQGRGRGAAASERSASEDGSPGKSGEAPGHTKMRPPNAGPKKGK
jgi:hypothetical protein